MVLDASALWAQEQLVEPERREETPEERNARVRRLADLVKTGGYAVQSHRLAMALLEWDPHRGGPKQSVEVADRRRAYMRAYMRRRRAQSESLLSPLPEGGSSPRAWPNFTGSPKPGGRDGPSRTGEQEPAFLGP